MNLDDLYIMLDEKEERDNPFITPKTKQAHDIFYSLHSYFSRHKVAKSSIELPREPA